MMRRHREAAVAAKPHAQRLAECVYAVMVLGAAFAADFAWGFTAFLLMAIGGLFAAVAWQALR